MNTHPLSCRCGQLRGSIELSGVVNRAVCYCIDCQSFAHALGQAAETLDEHGGTEIVAAKPAAVRFSGGRDNLACLSLSPRGLLRWYARCCGTPIGNTPRTFKVSYVGLVHTCLEQSPEGLGAFGPISLRVNTKSAHGQLPQVRQHTVREVLRVALMMASSRLSGGYRHTPFFSAEGEPIVTPRILTLEERESARRAATR